MFHSSVIKRVTNLSFSLINPEEFIKHAACEITSADVYTKGKNPKQCGLNDRRMGTTDSNFTCDTCHNSVLKCPGHFGYLRLVLPVYNPLFLTQTMMILNIVCSKCSRLLGDSCEDLLAQYQRITKNRKKPDCSRCGSEESKLKYTKDGMILSLNGESFYADEAAPILQKMNDDDIRLIGLNPEKSHPKFMLFTLMPIVPPCVRPSINVGACRSADDIVYKLTHLIRSNNTLEKKIKNKKQNYIHVYKEQLQWCVTTLIDNSNKTIPQSHHRANGRLLKSLKERVKGKEGRIRGNIIGKRCNYSARSVIDPCAELKITEIGVPIQICKILTFPERVHANNIDRLTQSVRNGPNKYPGANYVTKNGNLIDLRYARDLRIYQGDIVHRHICEADYVLVNRQPSLHRMSMMSHRVKPVTGRSFRLNPSCTTPYNADFDGDN